MILAKSISLPTGLCEIRISKALPWPNQKEDHLIGSKAFVPIDAQVKKVTILQ